MTQQCTSFYTKHKGEDNFRPIRRGIQPDVSGPAAWCHLVYATFLHLFTKYLRVLGPMKEWIQPDGIGPAA